MARLYPPVTEEVLSAFCLNYNADGEKTGASININFNLNRAVANAEISGLALRMRTISTNQYVITENLAINPNTGKSEGIALSYSLEDGICNFIITAENNPDAINILKVGQFYKIQIAFIDVTGVIGYWSTVATIKCVAKPSVTIANYVANDVNIFTNEILGEYIQDTSSGDSSEKVYSYRFQLFDSQNNLLDDTGVQLHNSSNDINSNSSTDEYYCYHELNNGESYYIIYSITTINGLSVSSPKYHIIAAESIDPEEDITLIVSTGLEENIYNQNIPDGGFPEWQPWEEGLIKIYPDLNDRIENKSNDAGNSKSITGNFVILRSSSKDNFRTWQEVRRFRLNNEKPYTKIIYDYTVEQGITYRYAIQQFNRQKFYSKKVYAYKRNPYDGRVLLENGQPIYNDIMADFEDMFLYDGKRQLKIRFNPKVSSFKNDLQEQKIDTIGSKHPFIFRNGNVCYKEFPISGLISFQQDNAFFFIDDEDYAQMKLSRFEADKKSRDRDKYITYTPLTQNEITQAINNNIQLYIYKFERKDLLNLTGHENKLSEKPMTTLQAEYIPLTTVAEIQSYIDGGWTLYKKIETFGTDEEGIDYKEPKTYSKTDLTSENIMAERYFKLSVLDWLTDGKPKLFRSPTEGNYIVRLLNVSLTPKTELGRMIHEFTCTAYEIADFNYQSLLDLGILSINEINGVEQQYFSRKINELLTDKNYNANTKYYDIDLENKDVNGFQCTGFAPGDKIRILIKGEIVPTEITIGTTGTYIYDEGKTIVSISILPIKENFGDFPRTILLATSSYANQKFDTIASINTHTQIGDQLVGPVENYLKKTTVTAPGDRYEISPNVNLIDNDGEKLRVSEILYLHAKKREVIPIFCNDTAITKDSKFYVTPYGQGYIRGKSILPKSSFEWTTKLGNLTDEEISTAMTIQELVEFAISKCNKDIFCLFSVYVPNGKSASDWIEYAQSEKSGADWWVKIYGIYDPWLYEQQALSVDKDNIEYAHLMGWWPKEKLSEILPLVRTDYGQYDPTITFHYGEEETVVSLAETGEIVLENIKVPDYITIGNGVVMESIFRVQYIDYTIENENNTLKTLRNNYFNIKKQAEENILKYIAASTAKQRGEYLVEKYNILLAELQDYENYKQVINLLTDNARIEQINKLKEYFVNEKSTVNMLSLQLQMLDIEIAETLGELYTSEQKADQRIYGEAFQTAKTNYQNFFSNPDMFDGDTPLLLTKENILNNITQDGEIGKETARKDIETFLYHIQNSTTYNFENIIESLKDNFNSDIAAVESLLDELENKTYVSQYLELLNKKGQELFFENLEVDEFKNKLKSNIFYDIVTTEQGEINKTWKKIKPLPGEDIVYLYQLVNKKQNNINNLKTTLITSPIWNDYFHLSDNLLTPIYRSGEPEIVQSENGEPYTEYKLYEIDRYINSEAEDYIPLSSDCILSNLKFSDNTSINIIETIQNKLEQLNKAVKDGGDFAKRQKTYNDTYAPMTYEDTKNINFDILKSNLKLGAIHTSGNSEIIINKKAHELETLLDILLLNTNNNIEEVISNIKQKSIYYSLPATKAVNLQDKLETYIRQYLTIDPISQKSAYSVYQEICSCITYRDEHQDTLSEEQKQIIQTTLLTLLSSEPFYSFTNNNEIFNFIIDSLDEQKKQFENIDDGNLIDIYKEELDMYISDFNAIINYMKQKIEIFNNYRTRYTDTLNTYNVSGNIKEILWNELQVYTEIQNRLTEIKNLFSLQITQLQANVIFEGYLDFLESYINYNKVSNTANKKKYLQLLEEANIMASAVVNEEYSPYNQNLLVQETWKNYLSTLSNVYITEVKERFS